MTTPTRLRSAETTARHPTATDARPALGEFGCLLGGVQVRTGRTFDVRSPYDSAMVAVVHRAGPAEIEQAIAQATAADADDAGAALVEACAVLERDQRHDRGPARRTCANDRARGRQADQDGADGGRSRRLHLQDRGRGEQAHRRRDRAAGLAAGSRRREAYVRRVPLGPVAGITPFNFPLNLVAHKVAPALAAGNPVIIRPATQTPVSALVLGEIAVQAGGPPPAIRSSRARRREAAPLVEDDRIKLLQLHRQPGGRLGARNARPAASV